MHNIQQCTHRYWSLCKERTHRKQFNDANSIIPKYRQHINISIKLLKTGTINFKKSIKTKLQDGTAVTHRSSQE